MKYQVCFNDGKRRNFKTQKEAEDFAKGIDDDEKTIFLVERDGNTAGWVRDDGQIEWMDG